MRPALPLQPQLAPVLLLVHGLTAPILSNTRIRAEFGARGLVSLADLPRGGVYHFTRDEFGIVLGGTRYESAELATPTRRTERDKVTYAWIAGAYRLEVVYELRRDWGFVSKQLLVTVAPAGTFRVNEVTVFDATLGDSVRDVYVPGSRRANLGTGDYGGALRFAGGRGLLAVVQNPFLHFELTGNTFSTGYQPDMDWTMAYGSFAADRGLLAPYGLSGRVLPARMLPEWKLGPADAPPGMDEVEVEAFTGLVRAFLITPPRPVKIFVGWCVNDYQIDVATPEGRAEYRRILDRAAGLGAEDVLFAPSNSDLSRREASVDDWSWEHVLWLALGQKIRMNQWDPKTGVIPPSVQELVDYARSRNLKLVAYVYPVLPFSQKREWLVSVKDDSTRRFASLGVRSLQDWLIKTLVDFYHHTGIGGYAFDHTFLTYDGSSRYAQWWGWRRGVEELRRRIPDIVIDGRQAYQLYGPWTWLAGSYPHPTSTDEQPESFVPFPDLHFDRVSADRERYTAYRYRLYEFAPSEIVPGFITHQTSRADDSGDMPEVKTDRGVMLTRLRARDWDYLGWRYSLLSSIAVAGWNNVVNMIPARDTEENRAFSVRDQHWFRHWIAWADTNKEYLRHTRVILGQPAIGMVDGTAAIIGARGYVFLFNPTGRQVTANVPLDSTIGLGERGAYVLRELAPLEERLVGKPGAGVWSYGDRMALPMDGESFLVLSIEPAPAPREAPREPVLFNAPGGVTLDGGVLRLEGVRGEVGMWDDLLVLVPPGQTVSAVSVNGQVVAFTRPSAGVVQVSVRFGGGAAFGRSQQVGAYDSTFSGGAFTGMFTIPQRVFDQLAARRLAWPIPWTAEDARATW